MGAGVTGAGVATGAGVTGTGFATGAGVLGALLSFIGFAFLLLLFLLLLFLPSWVKEKSGEVAGVVSGALNMSSRVFRVCFRPCRSRP